MTRFRGIYRRVRQVLYYLCARPSPEDLRRAARLLPPALYGIFLRMTASDQAHGARVANRLARLSAPDQVLTAAYLHDAGKPPDYGLGWRCAMVAFPGDPPEAEPPAGSPLGRARQTYHHHARRAAAAIAAAGGSPETIALVEGLAGTPWLAEFERADDEG